MIRFLISRLAQSLLVIALVYSGTFWLLMATPGDPFIGEKKPPDAVLHALRERFGIDNPVKAYGLYAWRSIRYGDFGPSIQYENWTVREIIAASLPVSVALGALALVLALWMGVAAGVAGALCKGRWPDLGLTVLTLFGVSLPTFVIATLLVALCAVAVPILPGGAGARSASLCCPRSPSPSFTWPTSPASRGRACWTSLRPITSARRGRKVCRGGA